MGIVGFLCILAIAVGLLMLLITKLDVHPIFAILAVATLTGLALGYGLTGTLDIINSGFGGTLGDIGIVIILGSTIAMAIQDTGAAKTISNFFVKLFRGKNLELATSLTAFIMSIPIFGDISIILMAPIASILAKRQRISMSKMTAFTQLGLNLTHAMVPPTPGILAVTLLLGANLGLTIFWTAVVALIAFFGTWLLLRKWTEKEFIKPRADFVEGIDEVKSDRIEELLIQEDGLPNILTAVAPVLIPVLMMAIGSFATLLISEDSALHQAAAVISDKTVALTCGAIVNILIGYAYRNNVLKANRELLGDETCTIHKAILNHWVIRGTAVALMPLLITGVGGSFSSIIKAAPAIEALKESVGHLMNGGGLMAIFIPWLIGVIMMSAVGSMTTAGMTAAGIMAAFGATGVSPIVTVIAIGAGTMMVDHMNDSGFWTITSFFNLNVRQGLKYITIPNAVASMIALVTVSLLNFVGVI